MQLLIPNVIKKMLVGCDNTDSPLYWTDFDWSARLMDDSFTFDVDDANNSFYSMMTTDPDSHVLGDVVTLDHSNFVVGFDSDTDTYAVQTKATLSWSASGSDVGPCSGVLLRVEATGYAYSTPCFVDSDSHDYPIIGFYPFDPHLTISDGDTLAFSEFTWYFGAEVA